MDPFPSDDPLHRLLGKSRPVAVRPDFTQNVLRAIRQAGQHETSWGRFQDWFAGVLGRSQFRAGALAVVTLFVIATAVVLSPDETAPQPEVVAVKDAAAADSVASPGKPLLFEDEIALETAVASDLESINQLSMLLARHDTASLTDSELAVLLY